VDQLGSQTVPIVVGGVAVLITLELTRRVLRRKPKRSSSNKKRGSPNRTSSRRSPPKSVRATRLLAEDLLELARQADVRPARGADREVRRVAKVSPGAALPLAWGPLELRIERAVTRVAGNSDDADLDSTVDRLRFLESKSSLSDEQARLFHRMRQLRNRAAHGELSSDEVDAAAARAYGRVAKALVGVLDKVR
jgi:hypothetical protein